MIRYRPDNWFWNYYKVDQMGRFGCNFVISFLKFTELIQIYKQKMATETSSRDYWKVMYINFLVFRPGFIGSGVSRRRSKVAIMCHGTSRLPRTFSVSHSTMLRVFFRQILATFFLFLTRGYAKYRSELLWWGAKWMITRSLTIMLAIGKSSHYNVRLD